MSKNQRLQADRQSTRREFAKTLTLVAAAPLLASADEPKEQKAKDAKPGSALTAAQALTEVVRLRHGQHLTEEQLKEIQRSLDRGLHSADRLKQFKLKNGDEPAFTFSAELNVER